MPTTSNLGYWATSCFKKLFTERTGCEITDELLVQLQEICAVLRPHCKRDDQGRNSEYFSLVNPANPQQDITIVCDGDKKAMVTVINDTARNMSGDTPYHYKEVAVTALLRIALR